MKDVETDEIDIKKLLSQLNNYKYSIVLFVVIFGIVSGYYAYFKPSIYQASMSLQVKSQDQNGYDDFLFMSPSSNSDTEDEIIILKSYPIAQKAVTNLSLGVRYFTYEYWRKKEFYQNSPFEIMYNNIAPFLYGEEFKIIPIDNKTFELVLEDNRNLFQKLKEYLQKDKNDTEEYFTFSHIYRYGELISTQHFSLSIIKKDNLEYKPYYFSIVPNKNMAYFIQNGLSATLLNKYGRIISVSFNDNVATRARDIVNQVAKAYMDKELEEKAQGAKKRLKFIDMQLNAINKTLQGSSQKLQKYKAMNIVVNLGDKTRDLSIRLSELESKLFEVKNMIELVDSALADIKNNKNIDFILPKSIDGVDSLIEQIRDLMAKYQTMSVNYTREHPGVKKLAKEIDFLKHSLIQVLEARYGQLVDESKRLQKNISKYKEELKSIPKQEQQLESLSRHFMVNEKIYSYLLEKRAETAILAASTISNIKVVEWANIPNAPVKPKRKLIVLVGLILGLIVGVAQALLRDMFNTTIKTQEDVESLSDIPIYGTLPHLQISTEGLYSEAIRSLWINLSFVKPSENAQVISFTSTVSGEGKTFTVQHLASTILYSTDKKVLLIDGDMRRPSLHKYYNLSNENGLSNYLAKHCCLDKIIYNINGSNLDIIPSGPKAPNPTKLIFSDTFDELIASVIDKYDYILIDTSPIGLVSDTLKIMKYANVTLFVLRMGVSKYEYLTHIQEIQEKYLVDMGLVLNDIAFDNKSFYGYKSEYTDYYQTVA